jgi:hypothetical protein
MESSSGAAVKQLLHDFMVALSAFSVREAAAESGLTHGTIQDMRRAMAAGRVPKLHPSTQRTMRDYLDRQKSSTVPRRIELWGSLR